jgi:hypothetical protein
MATRSHVLGYRAGRHHPAPGERRRGHSGDVDGHELAAGARLQTVDEVCRALCVAGRGEDRAMVCLEHLQPVGDVGGVVLTRFKRQIQIGTEKTAPSSATSSSIA